MAEYAIFGALLLRALGRELPALFFGIAYAVTDEIHQHFVEGRHASPFDVAFDGVGIAIGIFLLRLVQTRLASDPGHAS
jgi:VanZ family protein